MGTFNARAGTKIASVLLVAIALGGCGKRASSANDPVAARVADAPAEPMLRPGQWEMTVEDVRAASPTMGENPVPTELPKSRQYCLTPQAAAAITPETLTSPGGGGRACKREAWDVANGNINAQLVCPGMDDIKEVPTRISGSYSREDYRITVVSRVFGMELEQRIEAHRTGECAG